MTDATGRDKESTWATLRRRKVVQWAIAYAAGSWGLLQGLQFLAGAFEWPNVLLRLAAVALALGMPIVIVVAWYHGDRGEQRVTRVELAVVTLLFLVGGGVFWLYQRAESPALGAGAAVARKSETRPSIAVLPFENRSARNDDAFFVDGIHDDILTQLSKVSALKVISRTSVEQFRDTKLPTKAMAEQLGVKSILEGGVQRAGDRVRINVQLIDADTDAHLWAESYDRELTAANIFAIQSEVAASIARALQTVLTPGELRRVQAVPTRSIEAWEAYQLGLRRRANRSNESIAEAAALLRKAIAADPNFAPAYAALADTLNLEVTYARVPWSSVSAEIASSAAKAVELDPSSPEALTALAGWSDSDGQFERADELYRRAIRLGPNYAHAYHWYSEFLVRRGRMQDAVNYELMALELDPLSAVGRLSLGEFYTMLGQFDEARTSYRKSIEIEPSMPMPYLGIGSNEAYVNGNIVTAIPWLERATVLDTSNPALAANVMLAYVDLGELEAARKRLTRALSATKGADNHFLGNIQAVLALYEGRDAEAASIARQTLAADPGDPLTTTLVRNALLRDGKRSEARALLATSCPGLGHEEPAVDRSCYRAAIDLALVLQQDGDATKAATLLDRAEAVIAGMPRLSWAGFGLADVQIHALRGHRSQALESLRRAQHDGWRGPLWRYYRDIDPNLESIRTEPEFKAVFADIERDMARQRTELAARAKDAPLDLGSVR